VKAAALELGLPVTTEVADALEVGAELGVVVAFGRLIRRPVLERLPMINIHFSLLPRWRGAAPVERALLAGDERTGVCIMDVAEELDTGAVYASAEVPIDPDDTLTSLRTRLVAEGTSLLLACLADGLREPAPQTGEVSYAAKIDPAELHLDWTRPATELDRVIRLGGAWTTFRDKRLRVWVAHPVARAARGEVAPGTLDGLLVQAGEGAVELVEVQPEGKARIDAAAWRNGARPDPGEHLG
jgi:methionyl-tRNA formyltransferase